MSVVEHWIYSELKRFYKYIPASPQITQREVQKNWRGPFNIADSRRQKYDGSAIFSRRTTWLLCSKIAYPFSDHSFILWQHLSPILTDPDYFCPSPLPFSLQNLFHLVEQSGLWAQRYPSRVPGPTAPGDIQISCQMGILASMKLRTYQGWGSINAFQC